jgi:hypothetical protein
MFQALTEGVVRGQIWRALNTPLDNDAPLGKELRWERRLP